LDEEEEDKKRLDPETAQGKMINMFMGLVQEYQMLYNLLMIVNTKGHGDDEFIMN